MTTNKEKLPPKRTRVAGEGVVKAMAAILAGATPIATSLHAQVVTPSAISGQVSFGAEAKKPETKSVEGYLVEFQKWADENNQDRLYFEAFVNFHNQVLSGLDVDTRRKVILRYITDTDQYGSGTYWSYVTAGAYKKMEAIYGDESKLFEDLISTSQGGRFIFSRLFTDQEGDVKQELISTTILTNQLELQKHRDAIFKHLTENLEKLVNVQWIQLQNYRLLNILNLIYPVLTETQKQVLSRTMRDCYVNSFETDINTFLHTNNEVFKYFGIIEDPTEFKLRIVKEKFSQINDSNFANFKIIMEEIRNGVFSNKVQGEARYELQKQVYVEGLRTLVRGSILEGNAREIIWNTFQKKMRGLVKFKFDGVMSFKGTQDIDKLLQGYEEESSWIGKHESKNQLLTTLISKAISLEMYSLLVRDLDKIDEGTVYVVVNNLQLYANKMGGHIPMTTEQIDSLIQKVGITPYTINLLQDLNTYSDKNEYINLKINQIVNEFKKQNPIHVLDAIQRLGVDTKIVDAKRIIQDVLTSSPDNWKGMTRDEVVLFGKFKSNPDLLMSIYAISHLNEGAKPKIDDLWHHLSRGTVAKQLAKFEGGYDYILAETYKKNKEGIMDAGLTDWLYGKKYPHGEIVNLNVLLRGNESKMFLDEETPFTSEGALLWWNVLGRKYDQTRSYQPYGVWTLNEKLFYVYDSNRSSYTNLRTLDISDPNSYLDIFKRINEHSMGGSLWKEMVTAMDFSKFDKDVKDKLQKGKLIELTDEIVKFGNAIDPELTKLLFKRMIAHNKDDIEKVFLKWGFKKEIQAGKAWNSYTVDGLESLKRIETLFRIRILSGDDNKRTMQSGEEKDDRVNITLSILLDFDLDFLNKNMGLNRMMDIYGRFAALQNFSSDRGGVLEINTDKLVSALKTLTEKMVENLAKSKEGIQDIRAEDLEKIRATLNQSVRNSGNEFLNNLFSGFMSTNPSVEDLRKIVISFFDLTKTGKVDKDVEQTYRQMTNFALSLLLDRLSTDSTVNKSGFVKPLLERGFIVDDAPSNLTKALSGQYSTSQVLQKAQGKLFGTSEVGIGPVSKTQFESGMKDGANAEYICTTGICNKENAEAMLLTIDEDKVSAKLEVNRQGVVNTGEVKKRLGDKYIASGPIAFSAGGRLILDLAYSNGEQVGSHVKIDGRDGFIVVNKEGKIIVLNKRNMNFQEFIRLGISISPEDLDKIQGQSFNPVKIWSHKLLLDKIMKEGQLNAVTNMLLAEGGKQIGTPLTDGADSRRLFVKMKDGKFGIITSIKNMSTDKLVKMALSCGAIDVVNCGKSAEDVIYMDTGMYDSYEVVTKDGKTHSLGHRDTDASTQRLFLSYRE